MLMRFGMSEKLGPRVLGRNQDMPFLGREMASEPDYSEDMARDIDEEIHLVIEDGHRRARNVLEEHIQELHKLSGILIERETIDKDQFLRLLAGENEEAVFPPEPEPTTPEEKEQAAEKRKRLPRPKPFPLPGQAMQPPPPEGAQS
jgi:cell division protease FtsH